MENTLPPGVVIKVRSVKSAMRLLGRLTYAVQKGEIPLDTARLLTYMCSTYAAIAKDAEFEERLNQLENDLKNRKDD